MRSGCRSTETRHNSIPKIPFPTDGNIQRSISKTHGQRPIATNRSCCKSSIWGQIRFPYRKISPRGGIGYTISNNLRPDISFDSTYGGPC